MSVTTTIANAPPPGNLGTASGSSLTLSGAGVASTLKALTGAAVGSATPGASGVAFPAAAVAVADVNTLDDYEENAWTPVLTADGSVPTITYTAQWGRYTKVGDVVYVEGEIQWSAVSGGSGNAQIAGFPFPVPFTSQSILGQRIPITMFSVVGYDALGHYAANSFSALYIYALNATAPLSLAGAGATGQLAFKGHYHI